MIGRRFKIKIMFKWEEYLTDKGTVSQVLRLKFKNPRTIHPVSRSTTIIIITQSESKTYNLFYIETVTTMARQFALWAVDKDVSGLFPDKINLWNELSTLFLVWVFRAPERIPLLWYS